MGFIIKNKVLIISILITVVITATISFGAYKIITDKKIANQQIDNMKEELENIKKEQKKILLEDNNDELKTTTSIDESKEAVKNTPPVTKVPKVTATPPQKIEIEEPAKEKVVSCLTYANITVQVTPSECELIKQKNESSQKIDYNYEICLAQCLAVYRASIPVTSESQYNSVFGDGAYDDTVDKYSDERDDCNDDCIDVRKELMEDLWT